MTDEKQPCPRCARGVGHEWIEGDCVLRHRYDKRQHPPRAKFGHACGYCIDRHRASLREIPDLYATLPHVLEIGSVPDTTAEHGKPKKSPEAPAPVRLDVLAMLTDRDRLRRTGDNSDLPDVPGVLTELAQRCCDDNRMEGASLDGTLSAATRVLSEHAETIGHMPWIDEYDAELEWVIGRLRLVHGIERKGRSPVGRCPSLDGNGDACGGPLWPDESGRMAVHCGWCARQFDEPFLRHLGGMMEAS
jgi:hypothetical protein